MKSKVSPTVGTDGPSDYFQKPPLDIRSSRWEELRPLLARELTKGEIGVYETAIIHLEISTQCLGPKFIEREWADGPAFLPCNTFEFGQLEASEARHQIQVTWKRLANLPTEVPPFEQWINILLRVQESLTGSQGATLRHHEVMLDGIPLLDPQDIPEALRWLHSQLLFDLTAHPIFAAARFYQSYSSISSALAQRTL